MKWLSIADIAKITLIPAPTARRYASLFKDFLPSRKMGRVTRYPEQAVEVFRRIVVCYNEGLVTQEVSQRLALEFQRTIDVADPSEAGRASSGPALPEVQQALSGIVGKLGQYLEVIASQKQTIERQQQDIQKLKAAFVLLARKHKLTSDLPGALQELTQTCEDRAEDLSRKDIELEQRLAALSTENSQLREKIQILESELIRLRKDRRDMEKFFLEKIKNLTPPAR